MYLRWRERLQHEPSLRNYEEWPIVECDTISPAYQKSFLRNQKIVALVLDGQPLSQVAQTYHLTCAAVSQLMERCLGGHDSDTPPLTEGTIPFRHVRKSKRQTAIPSLLTPSGARCAFQALLDEVPGLSDGLDKFIEMKMKDNDRAQTVTPQSFHGEIKRLLKAANHPKDQYPYTTQSLAYESARQYLTRRTRELQLLKTMKKEQKTAQTQTLTAKMAMKHSRALENIQIDEQIADFQGKVIVELNDELMPLRVARGSILLCLDADTDCYLGFHLAYSPAPNQQDLLQLLDNVVRPWTPLPITTPGLEYLPGACFPSGLANGFPITFGTVHLDNAWIHRANSVREVITDKLGATLHLGIPAQPKQRNWVEAAFAYINQHVTHRFPSTTGSHPKDPIKESRKNAKRVPQVSMKTLNEALSVILTWHNITPCARLGGQSPLSLHKQHCAHNYLRYTPDIFRSSWNPFEAEQNVPIKISAHHSTPHINFYHVRYKGPGLTKAALKGKKVTVRFDRRDIRELRVYDKGGNFIGLIYAPHSWQRYPHSLATRQYICKLVRTHRLQGDDPLANFMHLLLQNKHRPKGALQLLRFHEEFSTEFDALAIPSASEAAQTKKSFPADKTKIVWTPASANRRTIP